MEKNEEKQAARLLLVLSNTIIKNRSRHMAAIDLTAAQADCLRFCLERGDGATVTELKDYLGVTHQTAQGLVRRMADKGLVSLCRSREDARCRQLFLTGEGRERADQMLRSRERTGGKLLQGMSPEERRAFLRLLRLAYENVKND